MNMEKILVIDDDEIFISTIRAMLKHDYEVIGCVSGNEALDLLYKSPSVHLILLDIMMPKMDGWEVFRRIKTIGFLFDTPIIFISSLDDAEAEKHAYEVGAKDFIRKPFQKEDLMHRISNIFQKKEVIA